MEIIKQENNLVNSILGSVKDTPVLSKENYKFLIDNAERFNKVYECVHVWRTDYQKRSIICDSRHPTAHSKFHQAILEQKVQFEQAIYLAKDYEMKKLEIDDLQLDLEDLTESKRDQIKKRRIEIEIEFKEYELKSMKVLMKYRMDEVKGWKQIEDELIAEMKQDGLTESEIWSKSAKEIEWQFFTGLNRLQGIKVTKDAGEMNNLMSFAKFCYQEAERIGILQKLVDKCDPAQRDSIKILRQQFNL